MKMYTLTIENDFNEPIQVVTDNTTSVFHGRKDFLLKENAKVKIKSLNIDKNIILEKSGFGVIKNIFDMPSENLTVIARYEMLKDVVNYDLFDENYITLKEIGTSVKMCTSILNENFSIEKVNDKKVRIYLDQLVSSGDLSFSSPAYLTMNRKLAKIFDYRGIQIGYDTNIKLRKVRKLSYLTKKFEIKASYFEDNFLFLVTNSRLPTHKHNLNINITNCNLVLLNKTHDVKIVSENIIKIQLNEDSQILKYKETSQICSSGIFEYLSSSKIYCDVCDFAKGDLICFNKLSGNGEVFHVDEVNSDADGDYVVVNKIFENLPNVVCKSHTQHDLKHIVNFSFENKTAYYKASKTDYTKEMLWLAHEPDAIKNGRGGSSLSYIEVYLSDLSKLN